MPDERANGEVGRSYLIEDAARLMGVSRRTIYYRIHDGRLRTIRTRCGSQRVLLSSMQRLVEAEGRTLEPAAAPLGERPEATHVQGLVNSPGPHNEATTTAETAETSVSVSPDAA